MRIWRMATLTWRYRDYVIAAFNSDKPFNRFVEEQIAGDLLPLEPGSAPYEGLIATGFLCLGGKMLAEDDPVKMQMDIIDEQVDTIGRAFMGLTLGCARRTRTSSTRFRSTIIMRWPGSSRARKRWTRLRWWPAGKNGRWPVPTPSARGTNIRKEFRTSKARSLASSKLPISVCCANARATPAII